MEIQDYPGYKIYEDGTIINKHGRQLLTFSANEYVIVTLYNQGRKQNKKVHRLVAEAYLGLKSTDIVDHKNRIKTDNRLSNLRIVSQLINCHNINPKSNNETGLTGIYIKNNRYLSMISIGGQSYKRMFDLDETGRQQSLHFRLNKKIEHGILV